MSLENWRITCWIVGCVAGVVTVVCTFAVNIIGEKIKERDKIVAAAKAADSESTKRTDGNNGGGITPSPESETWVIDVDTKQVGFVRASGQLNGQVGFLVYSFNIANRGNISTTLKDVKLLYKYQGRNEELSPVGVPTYLSKSFDGSMVSTAQIFEELPNKVRIGNLQKWTNIHTELVKRESKQPGGVWFASALYVFPPEVRSPDEISDLRICAIDYINRRGVADFGYDPNKDAMRKAQVFVHLGEKPLGNH